MYKPDRAGRTSSRLVDFEREMVQRGRLEHRVEDFARLSFAETSAGDKSLIRRR